MSFKKHDDRFINYIEFEENIWKYKIKQNTQSGLKRYYNCSPKDASCECMLVLRFESESVFIYKWGSEHNHQEIRKYNGISKEVKEVIKSYQTLY